MMVHFSRSAPPHIRCMYCGFHPLEIWALVYDVVYANTGRVVQRAEPALVCTSANGRRGCGCVFDPDEYNLSINDLGKKRSKII